ncbi:hypothetical protein BDN67DRAFT_267522 [Paxillus ammoniavirescens]|nr:hypothetical protein BDN67DRAFT_267522 [Paxillus ammoniavirescens]
MGQHVNVFPDGNNSLRPAFTVLPNVIEKSARSVIVHGMDDSSLITEGFVDSILHSSCADADGNQDEN